jgi:large subunit ribosomal protein L6
MSRIGKKPVPIPGGVNITLKDGTIAVKGPKGELKRLLPGGVEVQVAKTEVTVTRASEEGDIRARHGLVRAIINNMVEGVTKGFERKLEINGVGYRAAAQGKNLQLQLGYSHEISYAVPAGITIVTPKPTEIVISGIDKQKVGQVAAEIRDFRGPEPYKGKGVKYSDEKIFRKEGKKK